MGKQIYREMCDAKVPWDGELPEEISKRWEAWQVGIPTDITVPRTFAPLFHPISAITLHGFGDASNNGVSAAVYAVVEQGETTTQGLVCSKSRLAKQNLTIPRLELVAAHMAANLVTNVERAIDTMKVSSVHCWSDSTVVLYWINGQGEYRQFVTNRGREDQRTRPYSLASCSNGGESCGFGQSRRKLRRETCFGETVPSG